MSTALAAVPVLFFKIVSWIFRHDSTAVIVVFIQFIHNFTPDFAGVFTLQFFQSCLSTTPQIQQNYNTK